jgi:hypothetical protein
MGLSIAPAGAGITRVSKNIIIIPERVYVFCTNISICYEVFANGEKHKIKEYARESFNQYNDISIQLESPASLYKV